MKIYKTYPHRGQDPLIGKALRALNGTKFKVVAEKSGVSRSTLNHWKGTKSGRKTRRAFASTLNAALRSTGKKLDIVDL